jgi:DNA invertase Pin-like site-specific DNA recombinase
VDGAKKNKPALLDKDDVLRLMRAAIAEAGSQSEWARRKGINRTAVSAILNGRKGLQPKIVAALQLKKVEAYART